MQSIMNEFFAAANGYDGFISYFDSVFDMDRYKKIYVLKGGPGTGKSSFMKKILEKYRKKDFSFEKIYCSSDPESLDGITISKNEKYVAILDGTAPHTFDPTLPGAAQAIINLGASWNEDLLENNLEELKSINKSKSYHYESAYQFLSVCGKCTRIVDGVMKGLVDFPRSAIDDILSSIPQGGGRALVRLRSAFCKHGFYELGRPCADIKREIRVVGIYGSEYSVMQYIYDEAKRRSLDIILSPSPLDKNKIDSIMLVGDNTLISTERASYTDSATVIDTSRYIDIKGLNMAKTKLEALYREREVMLWCATDEFKKASDAHFAAEKIYTAAMDFKKNEKIFKSVSEHIDKIFFEEQSK